MGLEQVADLNLEPCTVLTGGDDRRKPCPADAPRVEGREMPPVGVVEVGPAAGHARPEVRADRPEHDNRAAGHVLAAMRPEPLDDGARTGIPDGKAHPRAADDVEAAAGRTVQARVAGDRLPVRLGREPGLRRDDDDPARKALRHVVVGLTNETKLDACSAKRAERLPGRAAQPEMDRAGELPSLDRAGQPGPE